MPLSHRSTSCSHRSIEPSIDQISSVPAVKYTLARYCKSEKMDGDLLPNWGQSIPPHDKIDCMYPPHGTCYSRMESQVVLECKSETCPFRHVPKLNNRHLEIFSRHFVDHFNKMCDKNEFVLGVHYEHCHFHKNVCEHCFYKLNKYIEMIGYKETTVSFHKCDNCKEGQVPLDDKYCEDCHYEKWTSENQEPDHMEREHYDPSDSGTDYDTSDGEDALYEEQLEREREDYELERANEEYLDQHPEERAWIEQERRLQAQEREFFAAPIVMPRVLIENIDERSIPRIPPSLGGSGLPPIASLRELRRFD